MAARSVEEIDEQIARLKARRQAAVARERKAERKARNHALMVMGGLLERACGGDWKAIDWDGLADALALERDYLSGRAAAEAVSTAEATARLRDWERRGREARKAGKAPAPDPAEAQEGAYGPISGGVDFSRIFTGMER